jgi:hypothetical protein
VNEFRLTGGGLIINADDCFCADDCVWDEAPGDDTGINMGPNRADMDGNFVDADGDAFCWFDS